MCEAFRISRMFSQGTDKRVVSTFSTLFWTSADFQRLAVEHNYKA